SSTSSSSTSTSSSTSSSTSLAVTWLVVQNANCTAAQAATGVTSAPVNCCTAAGKGFCDDLQNYGTLFHHFATIVAGSSQGYTAGGNAINTANLNKIKVTNIQEALCSASTKGHSVRMKFTANSGKRAPSLL